MTIVGTSDLAKRPDVGRGVGCRILDEPDTIEVLISRWQWAETIMNIEQTGQAAFTFVRPADYRAYQVKGDTHLRACEPADRDLSRRYIKNVTEALEEQGVPSSIAAVWLTDRDLVVARVKITSLSIKTPGSGAGSAIGEQA